MVSRYVHRKTKNGKMPSWTQVLPGPIQPFKKVKLWPRHDKMDKTPKIAVHETLL